MPSKNKRAKDIDVESLVQVLTLLASLMKGGGLANLLTMLGGFGGNKNQSNKNKKMKGKKLGASRVRTTAKRTSNPKEPAQAASKSWAEVLKTDNKDEWILDRAHWNVPVVESSALAAGASGVCLTGQAQARDIVAAGRKQVPAAIVTHKKTPLSEPAMLHLVKKGDDTAAVVRKMHITQIGSGSTYPRDFKSEVRGRNKLVILECHHDLSTSAFRAQLESGPKEAWQVWLKSKAMTDADLPELTSTRTSTYKGRTTTSTAGFVPAASLSKLLKQSGHDGVFIRVPKPAEQDLHKVIWLTGSLDEAWQTVKEVTDHCGMIRPSSGKFGLRVEASKMDDVMKVLPEDLQKSVSKHACTIAGLDPTLTRLQVQEEVQKLFGVKVEPNYSYLRYGVKHWTAWATQNITYTKKSTDMGVVVLSDGLVSHKMTTDAPPGLTKKRGLQRTQSAADEDAARAARMRQ
eukprot:6489941-Amphidinium_carterae.1